MKTVYYSQKDINNDGSSPFKREVLIQQEKPYQFIDQQVFERMKIKKFKQSSW